MSKSKTYSSWKIAFYVLLGIMLAMMTGYASYKLFSVSNPSPQVVRHDIIITSKDSAKIVFDSLSVIRLENAIGLVEKKNDGRFEVLTWATVLIITLLAGFITINFIVSSTRVKEIVDEKVDEKIKGIQDKISEKYEEISALTLEAEKAKELLSELLQTSKPPKND